MGHAETVSVLLEFGADAKARMMDAPLWLCVVGLFNPILWWLADRFYPRRGPTALWVVAAKRGNTHGPVCMCVHCPAKRGYGPVVEVLLKAGADKEAAHNGKSALWAAADGGLTPVVEVLLKAGADKEAAHNGKTALWAAAENICEFQWGRQSVRPFDKLLEAGANVEARDPSGLTLLCLSAIVGNSIDMEPLLKAGANMEARGKKACDTGFYEGTPLCQMSSSVDR